MKRYITIWWILTLVTSQIALQSRFGAVLFLIGKVVRFIFFFFFLIVLVNKTKAVAGYSLWQIIFFYSTFNLMDVLPQMLFRNVYRFRQQILNGYYDNLLTKPLNALFHPLFGGSDLLDGIILILSLFFLLFSATHLEGVEIIHIFAYLILVMNGLLISLALHIVVLGIGILSTAVDNTIMLYRDMTTMGRVPIEVYQEPLRSFLTFVIPVGMMMTFPVKALLGLLSPMLIVVSISSGGCLLLGSLVFWHYALRQYSSASS